MIRYLTAGESHGKGLIVILDGIPAGLKINEEDINKELVRRQKGYGRGKRMELESDKIEILSGVRWSETIGSPICLFIKNKDYENNKSVMSIYQKDIDINKFILQPRPGHADLSGILKFDRQDIRDISERASARETSVRVAAGAICKKFLEKFNIKIYSFVEEICGIKITNSNFDVEKLYEKIETSLLRCPEEFTEKKWIEIIDKAKEKGDTVGGIFTIIIKDVPPGLGSYTQWDLKLDACLSKGIMSIQGVKGIEFGKGFEFAKKFGSEVHDEIFYNKKYYRKTNNCGGIEGGMSNGEDIVIRAVMKPIPSLQRPLRSVNIKTKKPQEAQIVRADITAVSACAVIGEAVSAIEIANSFKEKFGGDNMKEINQRYLSYLKKITE